MKSDDIKPVKFKCPKCGYEWEVKSSGVQIKAEQRCPNCRKISENCLKKFNFFEKMRGK